MSRNLLIYIVIIVPFLIQAPIFAQSFSVSAVNSKYFPVVNTNFVLYDKYGNNIPDPSPNDFTVVDNGTVIDQADMTVECFQADSEPPANIVLVLDKSFSMSLTSDQTGESRWLWASQGAQAFVNALKFVAGTNVSVIAFNENINISSTFTDDKDELMSSISAEFSTGGTDYDPPFLEPDSGAVALLSKMPSDIRRIIIFLTDGSPNRPPKTVEIIKQLNTNNIQAYSITLLMPMNQELQRISDESGGLTFEVSDKDDLMRIYELIATDIQRKEFCTLSWPAPYVCQDQFRSRDAIITYLPFGRTITRNYKSPPHSHAYLTETGNTDFDNPDIGSSESRDIVVTAHNAPCSFNTISVHPPDFFSVVEYDSDNANPYLLDIGESATVSVKFTQNVSKEYREAELYFDTEPCPHTILLTAGIPRLHLEKPNGGEIFSVCDSIDVRWSGILPNKEVNITIEEITSSQYQSAESEQGLHSKQYPGFMGEQCRVVITHPSQNTCLWANSFGSTEQDFVSDIHLTSNNLILISGNSEGLSDQNDKNNLDIFISKLTPGGRLIWSKAYGGPGLDSCGGICTDGSGTIYITGACSNEARFDSFESMLNEDDAQYLFVAKLDSNGNTQNLIYHGRYWGLTLFRAWGMDLVYDNDTLYCYGQYIGETIIDDIKFKMAYLSTPFCLKLGPDLKIYEAIFPEKPFHSPMTIQGFDRTYAAKNFNDMIKVSSFTRYSEGLSDIIVYAEGASPEVSDDSDSLFTITEPEFLISSHNQDFMDTRVGKIEAEPLPVVISNPSLLPLENFWLSIRGIDSSDFRLDTAFFPIIPPGTSQTFTINFWPQTTGEKSAYILLQADCAHTDTIQVSGQAYCDVVTITDDDFGMVNVNLPKDHDFACLIKNNNGVPVVFDYSMTGPHSSDFQLTGIKDQIIYPDSCLKATIRFIPTDDGPRLAQLNIDFGQGCGLSSVNLTGEGVHARFRVSPIDWGLRRVLTINDSATYIINENPVPAIIESIQIDNESCFITVELPDMPYTLDVGDSLKVPVSFVPDGKKHFQDNIVITALDYDSLFYCPLTGRGFLPAYQTDNNCPENILPGESSTIVFEIINTEVNTPLYINEIIMLDNGPFQFIDNIDPHIVGPGETHSYPAVFSPSGPGYSQSGILVISDAKPGPGLPAIDSSYYEISCDCQATEYPEELEMDDLVVCGNLTDSLVIKNLSAEKELQLTGIEYQGSEAFIVEIPSDNIIKPLDSAWLKVTFIPESSGKHSSMITIHNSFNSDISVALSGMANAAEIQLDGNDLIMEPNEKRWLRFSGSIISVINTSLTDLDIDFYYDNRMILPDTDSLRIDNKDISWTIDDDPYLGRLSLHGSGLMDLPYRGPMFSLPVTLFPGDSLHTNIIIKSSVDSCMDTFEEDISVTVNAGCRTETILININSGNYFMDKPYPNPAVSYVNLDFGLGLDATTRLQIINSIGELVYLKESMLQSGEYNLQINTENFPAGCYFIKLQSGPYTRTRLLTVAPG